MEIIIDEEFKNIIPPLTDEEYNLLEQSIINEGVRDPLVVWEYIIVDGHNRFEIAQKHGIKFEIIQKEFESTEQAKIFIIENQLGRRNISKFIRSELVLEMKHIFANQAKENLSKGGQISQQGLQISAKAVNTREELAKLAEVSHDTISKVEQIKEKADTETLQKLRAGEISINEAHTQIKKVERKEYLDSNPNMTDKYGAPPFSVLDTKQGYWKERKEKWLNLGIKSELGRDVGCNPDCKDSEYMPKFNTTTSVFDPVLCELMYKWFCPPGGNILDPFAGGSVRGIVAAELGFNYTGIDLHKNQINENVKQADIICNGKKPIWYVGDSLDIKNITNAEYDFCFSCPPYHDLEVYTEDPHDISNMDYDEFLITYKKIIKNTVSLLKDDSFACFVVSEIRDKQGMYKNFISETIEAFLAAGTNYYNELILVNSAGTLPFRAGRYMEASRKIGRMHQNILVFLKGDIKKAANKFKEQING